MTFHQSFGNGRGQKIAEMVWLPALLALASSVLIFLFFGNWFDARRDSPVAVAVPSFAAEVIGPEEVVFDTQNGCEAVDIPDQPARAFRDERGMVHLIASHFVARAMVGPSLNQLKRDCRVLYRSPEDPDPSHFQFKNWLFSFYTADGRRIAALVHSEYDGVEIPGMCATPEEQNNCWWNTVTYAESLDGGFTFKVPVPPQNLVAALPYRYVVGNRASAYGYSGPTNIMRMGGFYYSLINDWGYRAQKVGPCLIRTASVFDPQSWRAWDGKGYNIQFADPYREAIPRPEERVCEPVLSLGVDSLLRHAPSGNFIVTEFVINDGFYMQASRDLMHWSSPTLLAKLSDLQPPEAPHNWTYGYVSLLDPTSTDANFSTVSDTPYLYYVRTNAPYGRTLLRRRIKLQFSK